MPALREEHAGRGYLALANIEAANIRLLLFKISPVKINKRMRLSLNKRPSLSPRYGLFPCWFSFLTFPRLYSHQASLEIWQCKMLTGSMLMGRILNFLLFA